jgi:hypothetical protein
MSRNILEYETRTPREPRLWFATVCFGFITVPLHNFFSFFAGIWLEERFSNSTVSWTSIAWLPVCIGHFTHSDQMVALLVLFGSLVAGVVTASTTVRCLFKIKRPLGSNYWRLWLTLCLWLLWFPVPRLMAVMPYG